MNLATYFTGWITKKAITTVAWIAIPLFLVVQCNRGCGADPQPVSFKTFDYTAIAVSLPKNDTTELDTIAATEDLQKLIPAEMVEFAKANSSLFARFLSRKYVVSNGYVEKIDSTE
jgi:hypothetical protein